MNIAVLIGRLVRDPELRYTQSGKAVSNFTLAVDRGFKDANGEKQADFIDCVAWGKQAENLAQYMAKGSQVAVDGRIQTGSYEHEGQKRKTVEVIADRVEFIGSKGKDKNQTENDGWDDMGEVVF